MEKNQNVRTVTLKDLWELAVSKAMILLLAAVIAAGGFLIVDRLTYTPEYASKATLYILRQNEGGSTSDASNEFSLALKLVNDCTYMLKSHAVLDEVRDQLELDMSYSELYDRISTSNPENTRVLEVTARADTPEDAKRIVDALCEIGTEKIASTMSMEQMNLFEYGVLEEKPCNGTSVWIYFLVGVIAAVLVYIVFLLAFLLDDRIRSDEEIEKLLGLSILGDIPNADEPRKDGYGYYSAYRSRRAEREDK